LALAKDMLLDVLERRIVRTHAVEVEREITLAAVACRTRVILAARPPDADEPVHREVGARGLAYRRRAHRAPAPHDHPRRLVTANAQPLGRLVLHFCRRNRIELGGEAVLLGELLKQGNRLAAIAAVEEDVADRLPLELVEA